MASNQIALETHGLIKNAKLFGDTPETFGQVVDQFTSDFSPEVIIFMASKLPGFEEIATSFLVENIKKDARKRKKRADIVKAFNSSSGVISVSANISVESESDGPDDGDDGDDVFDTLSKLSFSSDGEKIAALEHRVAVLEGEKKQRENEERSPPESSSSSSSRKGHRSSTPKSGWVRHAESGNISFQNTRHQLPIFGSS
jgi:hypothetical protein